MNELPFFVKLGVPIKLDYHVDNTNINLYDKGESCYIPMDGVLKFQDFIIQPGQLYAQISNTAKQFNVLTKESSDQKVVQCRVKQLLAQLTDDVIEDIKLLRLVCNNNLLHTYQKCPIVLYPYLEKVHAYSHQRVVRQDSIIFVAQGSITQQSNYINDSCEAESYCVLFILKKQDIPLLQYFGQVRVTIGIQQEMPVRQTHLCMEDNRIPNNIISVIRGQQNINQLLNKQDQQILQQRLHQQYGKSTKRKSNSQAWHKQVSNPSSQEGRTKLTKTTVKRVIIRTQVQRVVDHVETSFELNNSHWEAQRTPNRQKHIIPRKVEVATMQNVSTCLPIIKSYSKMDQQQARSSSTPRQKQLQVQSTHKYFEFVKYLENQLQQSPQQQ